jgi:Fe-S-cluster containining protein
MFVGFRGARCRTEGQRSKSCRLFAIVLQKIKELEHRTEKCESGFRTNPMLKQRARAAKAIQFERSPL